MKYVTMWNVRFHYIGIFIFQAAVQDTLNMAEGVDPVFSHPAPPSPPPASELRYRQPHPQHQLPAVR